MQKGFALILVLLFMISGSSWWLAQSTTESVVLGQQQLRLLNSAKRALLYYAVSYADLYGPTGAGPGHFPCPDTDAELTVLSPEPFSGEGPDPPCGNGQVAIGYLPRHVNLAMQRYAFHTEASRQIRYVVSTRFVNNPINRVVNPGVVATSESTDDSSYSSTRYGNPVIVNLTVPDHQPASTVVTLSWRDIAIALRQRVALWFIEYVHQRMQERRQAICATADDCQRAWHDGDFAAFTGVLAETVTDCDESDVNSILHWIVELCDQLDPKYRLIEGVALSRHWFYRNLWQEWISITVTPRCSLVLDPACKLRYRRAEHIGSKLQFEFAVSNDVPE